MPGSLKIEEKDAQGALASNTFTVASAVAGTSLLEDYKLLTNCEILSAHYSENLDVSGVANNVPVAANNESAKTKAVLTLSGAPAAAGLNRPTITVQIPAPIGSLISSDHEADTDNILFDPLINTLKTPTGGAVTRVDRIDYAS